MDTTPPSSLESIDWTDPVALAGHDASLRALARHVLFDRSGADDVVQDTWLAALTKHGASPRSPRAWLLAVLRHLASKQTRGEQRRQRRETAFARRGGMLADEDVSDLFDREAARRRIVDAVLSLDEPYRTTLVLRYFEDKKPRHIARAMGAPIETVRTRLQRGHERLRQHLEGGRTRRDALLALAPLGHPPSGTGSFGTSFLVASEILLLSTKAKVVTFAAALVAAAFVLFHTLPGSATPPPQRSAGGTPTALVAPVVSNDASPVVPTRAAIPNAPVDPASEVSSTEAARRGSVVVHVVWSDQTKATNVYAKIYCFNDPDPYFEARTGKTDREGVFRVDDLRPGGCVVVTDRGAQSRFQLVAGETKDVTIEIEPGATVNGIVRGPNREPFEGADIWMSGLATGIEGFIVARSDREGKFSIRDVTSLHGFCAHAKGYAPSTVPEIVASGRAPIELELRIEKFGGSIAGRVLAPNGEAVPFASVVVDGGDTEFLALANGQSGTRRHAQFGTSDRNGSFVFDSVEAGSRPLEVRARGFAPWSQRIEVALGVATQPIVQLVPSASIEGTIYDAAGKPVANAEIDVGRTGALEAHGTRSDASGRYRVEDVPVGTVPLTVDGGVAGKLVATIETRSQSTVRFDVHLAVGLFLRGRVVDPSDQPIECTVSLEPKPYLDGEPMISPQKVEQDGTFEFVGLRETDYRLAVLASGSWSYPVLVMEHVRPQTVEQRIRVDPALLPSASVVLRAVDSLDRPIEGATVLLSFDRSNTIPIEATDADGGFRRGPLSPGRYRVEIKVAGDHVVGDFVSPEKELHANEEWDLGTVKFEAGGTLRLVPVAPNDSAGTLRGKVGALIEHADGSARHPLTNETGGDGTLISPPLFPGAWRVCVFGEGIAVACYDVEIASGRETKLSVGVREGLTRTMRIVGVAGPTTERANLRIANEDGTLRFESEIWRNEDASEWTVPLVLEAGSYIARVALRSGKTATEAFTVQDDVTSDVVVTLK